VVGEGYTMLAAFSRFVLVNPSRSLAPDEPWTDCSAAAHLGSVFILRASLGLIIGATKGCRRKRVTSNAAEVVVRTENMVEG